MRNENLRIALVVLAIAAAVGLVVAAPVFYDAVIGLDPSGFPFGHVLQPIGELVLPRVLVTVAGVVLAMLPIIGVALLAGIGVARRKRRSVDPGRRSFLLGSASGAGAAVGAALVGTTAGVGGAMLGIGNRGRGWGPVFGEIFGGDVSRTHPEWKEAWRGSRVRAHRRLGRTEWRISDVSLGTGGIRGDQGERIARLAIERGVNYFDTAPDYADAGTEEAMGRAIRGLRDQVFIATKFCTPIGHLPAGAPVARYVAAVEGSLSRLDTDYVDLVHVHGCDEVERLLDPNLHEAFDRLREAGKVRFLGFSSHTPRLAEVADAAITSDRFDVMMLAYHHGIFPSLGQLIERGVRERDMGVVAMKTLKGAKHRTLEGFEAEADSFAQAALRWVLANGLVSSAVISFSELQHVDEYLAASGTALSASDLAVLAAYDRAVAGSYCSPHCGACLSRCPEAVPIDDVLRHRMYFEDYGREKEALRLYAALATDASACLACSGPCLGACPTGVAIPDRMRGAHALLRPDRVATTRTAVEG